MCWTHRTALWRGRVGGDGGAAGDGGRDEDCTPEIKSFSLRTMAWNKPCMAAGSLTGRYLFDASTLLSVVWDA